MATKLPTNFTNKEIAEFDSVAIEIMKVFNPLIAELVARRDTLLKDLSNLKSDYSDKEIVRKNAIDEIENAQQLMLQLKENANISAHKEATDDYINRLQQLETPIKLPRPYFNYPRLKELQTLISEFGEVSETETDHSHKNDKLQNREAIPSVISSTTQPKHPTCPQDPNFIGSLAITVAQARLNKSSSLFATPYCTLTVGGDEFETDCEFSQTPKWDTCFEIDLLNSTTGFNIEIFDFKLLSDDLRIAWAHIEIPTRVLYGELVEDWFPLDGKLGEGKEGSILISFQLY